MHLVRCEWAVWLWPCWLRSEKQHPSSVEAALHPGGADPWDRLHHAHPRACPEVGHSLIHSPKNRKGSSWHSSFKKSWLYYDNLWKVFDPSLLVSFFIFLYSEQLSTLLASCPTPISHPIHSYNIHRYLQYQSFYLWQKHIELIKWWSWSAKVVVWNVFCSFLKQLSRVLLTISLLVEVTEYCQ